MKDKSARVVYINSEIGNNDDDIRFPHDIAQSSRPSLS